MFNLEYPQKLEISEGPWEWRGIEHGSGAGEKGRRIKEQEGLNGVMDGRAE